jgi:hypothetical protein
MVWCIGLGCFDLDASGGGFAEGISFPSGCFDQDRAATTRLSFSSGKFLVVKAGVAAARGNQSTGEWGYD